MRMDNIAYTMYPVSSMSQLVEMYNHRTEDIKTVVMLNCGAVLNIPRLFNLEHGDEDMKVFILDNHRPIHLANIHSVDNIVCFDDNFRIEYDLANDLIPDEGMDDVDLSSSEDEDEDVEDDEEDDDDEGSGEEEDEEAEEDGSQQSEEAELEDEEEVEEEDDKEAGLDEVDKITAPGVETPGVDVGEAVEDTLEDTGVEEEKEEKEEEEEVEEEVEEAEEEEEEGEVVKGKKRDVLARRYDPERINKHKAKVYYGAGSSYAAPTTINLLWLLRAVFGIAGSHIPQELVWQMIIGTTDQYLNAHITEDMYLEIASRLSVSVLE